MLHPAPFCRPHIEQTVRAIAELHAEHRRRATPIQRLVRSVGTCAQHAACGRLSDGFHHRWIVANVALDRLGRAFDTFPYPLLQDAASVVGVYITVLILIVQRRDDELAQHREQLTLELAILGSGPIDVSVAI